MATSYEIAEGEVIKLLQGIERITGYRPDASYYAQIHELICAIPEGRLSEAFARVANIATDSMYAALEEARKAVKDAVDEQERREHFEDAKMALESLEIG